MGATVQGQGVMVGGAVRNGSPGPGRSAAFGYVVSGPGGGSATRLPRQVGRTPLWADPVGGELPTGSASRSVPRGGSVGVTGWNVAWATLRCDNVVKWSAHDSTASTDNDVK